MTDITNILLGAILIAFGIAGAFVIPLLRQKLGDARFAEMAHWVQIGVKAAEQIFGSGNGPAKKKHVLAFLERLGYTADFDRIDAMIESEVLALGVGHE